MVFTQHSMYIFSIVMLVLEPLIIFLLYRLPDVMVKLANSSTPSTPSTPPASRTVYARRILSGIFSRPTGLLTHIKELRWTKSLWWKERWSRVRTVFPGWASRSWRWAKFWATFILGLVLQVILVLTILSANPFVRSPSFLLEAFTHPTLDRLFSAFPSSLTNDDSRLPHHHFLLARPIPHRRPTVPRSTKMDDSPPNVHPLLDSPRPSHSCIAYSPHRRRILPRRMEPIRLHRLSICAIRKITA